MTQSLDPEFLKDLNALIEKEVRKHKLEELLETDWTVERMMNAHGLTETPARRILDDLTKQGHFVKIRIANPSGGGARVAYRPVEKKKEKK